MFGDHIRYAILSEIMLCYSRPANWKLFLDKLTDLLYLRNHLTGSLSTRSMEI